jgi:hypothetical protein
MRPVASLINTNIATAEKPLCLRVRLYYVISHIVTSMRLWSVQLQAKHNMAQCISESPSASDAFYPVLRKLIRTMVSGFLTAKDCLFPLKQSSLFMVVNR